MYIHIICMFVFNPLCCPPIDNPFYRSFLPVNHQHNQKKFTIFIYWLCMKFHHSVVFERLHMDAVILAKFINGMNFRKSVRRRIGMITNSEVVVVVVVVAGVVVVVVVVVVLLNVKTCWNISVGTFFTVLGGTWTYNTKHPPPNFVQNDNHIHELNATKNVHEFSPPVSSPTARAVPAYWSCVWIHRIWWDNGNLGVNDNLGDARMTQGWRRCWTQQEVKGHLCVWNWDMEQVRGEVTEERWDIFLIWKFSCPAADEFPQNPF